MKINFRNYQDGTKLGEDYQLVRDFFLKLPEDAFTYARWDWMITHGMLDSTALGQIGLWFDDDNHDLDSQATLIGVATYDVMLGSAYCFTLPGYEALKTEIYPYAAQHLSKDSDFNLIISDHDAVGQSIAAKLGYVPTPDHESDAIFLCDETPTNYILPDGYTIVDMASHYNAYEYLNVLWKGFEHEKNGEGPLIFTEEEQKESDHGMFRENVDLSLRLAVMNSEGHYVAYCGMWYDPFVDYAVIEPVATDPYYRRMGLGRAVVLEGIKRVKAMGAKKVFVGSNQQFYYSLGMRPYQSATMWRPRSH